MKKIKVFLHSLDHHRALPGLVDESDIRSSTLGVLIDLRRELNKAQKKYSSNKSVKNHLLYCVGLINNS